MGSPFHASQSGTGPQTTCWAMLASMSSEGNCCTSAGLCGLGAIQPPQSRLQCILLTEVSCLLPGGLAIWDQGQLRQVLSLEESSLRLLGSLSSRSLFFSLEQLSICRSHPWSAPSWCICDQSWPMCPCNLHLSHHWNWLPSLTMDQRHHYGHRTVSDPATDLLRCSWPDLITWPQICHAPMGLSGSLDFGLKTALLAVSRSYRMALLVLPFLLKPVMLCFTWYSDWNHHIYGQTQRSMMKCSSFMSCVWRTCTIKHMVNIKNAKSGKNRG